MTEKEAYAAFNMTGRVGSTAVSQMVAQYGNIVEAWERYSDKTTRLGDRIEIRREFDRAAHNKVTIITPIDPEYPPQLLATRLHPLALYVKGDVKVLAEQSIAIIGTRKATQYGLDQAYRFGRDLASDGWAIVSGLALGVDAESHRGALASGCGKAIGVIGSALNRFYPEANLLLAREIVEKGGAVASEYPFDRSPDKTTFPQRNRIVAALARGVLVVEAPFRSGTMITAGMAADLGRTVMAVPGRVDTIFSAGCLDLIRNGAILVRTPADVEAELGKPDVAKDIASAPRDVASAQSVAALSGDEKTVLAKITAEGEDMDKIARETKFGAGKVHMIAMKLVMGKLARFLPGNRLGTPRG